MIKSFFAFAALGIFSPQALASDVTPVSQLDVQKYMGTWFEVASFPQVFQTGCTNTTANYTLMPDATVKVVNKCRLFWSSGFPVSATGVATIPNAAEPAKLKVSFFNSSGADYWVLDVAPDYSYALVGDPSRKYLWILSRAKTLDATTYEKLVDIGNQQEFDTTRLRRTTQN